MQKKLVLFCLSLFLLTPEAGKAQINEKETGAWYMYFFNHSFQESSWGVQGDIQFRNWNIGGDLEQLLLRGGLTYKPKDTNIKFTLGYGNITTGAYGSDKSTTGESRIYQEILYPTKIGTRFLLNHRIRYEQRFVENQDFRTRYRYNLFLTIPLNKAQMEEKTVYLSLYNEIFINGQRKISKDKEVEIFDRNRFYSAIGYMLKKDLKIQFGLMKQNANSWNKQQLQLSVHQTF